MRYFTGYKNIDDLAEGTAVTLYPLFKQGEIGYDVRTRHKDKYKTAQNMDLGVSESRIDRAEYILSQLKDHAEVNARRVNDALQQPQNGAASNAAPDNQDEDTNSLNDSQNTASLNDSSDSNRSQPDDGDDKIGSSQSGSVGVVTDSQVHTNGLGSGSTTDQTSLRATHADPAGLTNVSTATQGAKVDLSAAAINTAFSASPASAGGRTIISPVSPELAKELDRKEQEKLSQTSQAATTFGIITDVTNAANKALHS
jgi:hypothetical protein